MNSQTIEFASVARDSSVPMSTVKEYFSILEGHACGDFLWLDRSERKKSAAEVLFL